jgi:hypothetical protein
MAVKGANSPFNVCYATTPTSKVDAQGVVTAGNPVDYYFQSSSIYAQAEVATRTGIKLVAADKWEGEEPLVKIEQMILSRKLVRLIAEYESVKDGIKTVALLATKEKAGGLLSDDKTKNLDGLAVLDAKGVSKGVFFNVRTGTRNRFS